MKNYGGRVLEFVAVIGFIFATVLGIATFVTVVSTQEFVDVGKVLNGNEIEIEPNRFVTCKLTKKTIKYDELMKQLKEIMGE